MLDAVHTFDWSIVRYLSELSSDNGSFASFALVCAEYLILALIPILFLIWHSPEAASKRQGNKKAIILALVSLVFAVAVKSLIAVLYFRARPFVAHPELLIDIVRLDPQSFPSGHTLIAATITASLWMSGMKKIGWVLIVLTFLVAFGRVATGVHYPTDVIGSMVIGTFIAWLLHRESSSLKRYLPNS